MPRQKSRATPSSPSRDAPIAYSGMLSIGATRALAQRQAPAQSRQCGAGRVHASAGPAQSGRSLVSKQAQKRGMRMVGRASTEASGCSAVFPFLLHSMLGRQHSTG